MLTVIYRTEHRAPNGGARESTQGAEGVCNPTQEARQEIGRRLNFSYCLDWRFMVHTEPKRPFHSRIGVFIYQDDYVDLGWLAYGLVEIYEWFSDACMQLRDILQKKKADIVKLPGEEVMAA